MDTRRSMLARRIARRISKLNNQPSITIIGGANATGKTTLAKQVVNLLGQNQCVLLDLDDYQYSRQEKRERGITGQNPKGTKLDQARKDIFELVAERPIFKPLYEFRTGNIIEPEIVLPNRHLIVNGTSAFADEIGTLADVSVFLEAADEELMRRRLKRDTAERGYSEERVRVLFPELERDYRRFIEPMKGEAGLLCLTSL